MPSLAGSSRAHTATLQPYSRSGSVHLRSMSASGGLPTGQARSSPPQAAGQAEPRVSGFAIPAGTARTAALATFYGPQYGKGGERTRIDEAPTSETEAGIISWLTRPKAHLTSSSKSLAWTQGYFHLVQGSVY